MYYIKGTRFADQLAGTSLPEGDHINGRQGDDVITGYFGDDRIWGGRGNDILSGNMGDDYLSGMDGDDVLYGGVGINTLLGGSGNDTLHTRWDGGTLDGGVGDDTLVFEGCNGQGSAGDGNDTVLVNMENAASTVATVSLGAGNDTLIVDQRAIGNSVVEVTDWRPGDKIIFFADDGRDTVATFRTFDTNGDGELGAGDGPTEFGTIFANEAEASLYIRFDNHQVDPATGQDIVTYDHVILRGTLSLDISEMAI